MKAEGRRVRRTFVTRGESFVKSTRSKAAPGMSDSQQIVPVSESDEDAYFTRVESVMAAFNKGDPERAIAICEEILADTPESPEAHFFLGVIAFTMHDQGRAIELVELAHRFDPDCREYAQALANLYARVGKLTESLYFEKLSLALGPHIRFTGMVPANLSGIGPGIQYMKPSTHILDATRALNKREFAAAVEACGRELRINKDNVAAFRLLGKAQLALGHPDKAIAAYHAAIHLDGNDAADFANLALAQLAFGQFPTAQACLDEAQRLAPTSVETFSIGQHASSFMPDDAPADHKRRAQAWQKANPIARVKRQPLVEIDKRRMRIGILSDCLYRSDLVDVILSVFQIRDARLIELYTYQRFAAQDSVGERFESLSDRWTNLYDVDDETAAIIIRGDELDVLLNLSMEPDGRNTGILMRRPSPVIVNWLGATDSAGVPGPTHYLTDPVLEAADKATALAGQKAMVLQAPLIAFNPPKAEPLITPSPAQQNGAATFGGRCDLARLTPRVAATWARILHAVPGSTLLLGVAPTDSIDVKVAVTQLFHNFGITGRIAFEARDPNEAGPTVPLASFFERIDVLLDTFPVNGIRESALSLWMGVPVVTLAGTRRAGLMGASLLTAAERTDWIAEDVDAYVATATQLASSPDTLATLRGDLPTAVLRTALFQPIPHERALERALTSL